MALVTLMIVTALQAGGPACGKMPELAAHPRAMVRSHEKWLTRLIDDGLRRSATFAALVATIDGYRAIVYVEPRTTMKGNLTGAVPVHVVRAPGGTRSLRVWVLQRRSPNEVIATMGHELQHVIELLESGADEGASVPPSTTTTALDPATGCRTFETDALCGSVLPFTGSWWPAVGRGRLRRKDQRPVISTLQASW